MPAAATSRPWLPPSIAVPTWLTSWRTMIAATLIVVLGAKWFLIGIAGSPTPFWDQWDAIADKLIVPYLDGTLTLGDLLAPHNEHRITTERLLALGLIEVAGTWNVILEMVVNAALHVGFLAGLVWTLRNAGPRRWPGLFAVMLLALWALPADAGNSLCGFQGQFYFLVIFALAALILYIEAAALGVRWWLATACAIGAFYSMAAGSLAIVAALVIVAAQLIAGVRRRSLREGAGAAIMAAVAVTMIAVTPPSGDDVKVASVWAFVVAFTRTAGWPYYLPLLAPLLLNAPALALAVDTLRRRARVGAPAWRVLALAVWMGLACAAIAYSRSTSPIQSRYVDLYGILLVANVAALCLLIERFRPSPIVPALWIALTLGSLVFAEARMLPQEPLLDGPKAVERVRNVRVFLATDDAATLQQPLLSIPYPDPARLTLLLRQPAIVGVLPPSLGAPTAARQAVRARLALHGGLGLSPEMTSRAATLLGMLLMTLGTTLLALGWILRGPDLQLAAETR